MSILAMVMTLHVAQTCNVSDLVLPPNVTATAENATSCVNGSMIDAGVSCVFELHNDLGAWQCQPVLCKTSCPSLDTNWDFTTPVCLETGYYIDNDDEVTYEGPPVVLVVTPTVAVLVAFLLVRVREVQLAAA